MGKIGKRKSLIFANMVGAVGVAISLVQNLYTFCVGRLIYGFSIGVIQAVAPSFLLQTVPSETINIFGPMISFSINIGVFTANAMAFILPTDSSDPNYLTS